MKLLLENLPKISLNRWYAGCHWSERDKIKNQYAWIIKSQFKRKLSRENKYICEYHFQFKKNPLDASNCVAMVKMIEDCLFENDKYDIVLKITISSEKGTYDLVTIIINEVD